MLASLYQAFREALDTLDTHREVFCGFSGNVDTIIPIQGDDFAALRDRLAPAALPFSAFGGEPPSFHLTTIGEVCDYVSWFIATGNGAEANLESPQLLRPFLEALPHYHTAGGTGMKSANWLAAAGFHNVRLYVPFRDGVFERLVDKRVRLFSDNRRYAAHMADAREFSGQHFLFDYAEGTAATFAGERLTAPRADRVILSADRVNSRLRISREFIEAAGNAAGAASLLVTGFNSPRTNDDFDRFIDDCVAVIGSFRRGGNAGRFVHVEDCHCWDDSDERRKSVAARVLPLADSYGMNEAEYRWEAESFGQNPDDVRGTLLAFARRFGLRRVCLHHADRNHLVTNYSPREETRAMGLAVLLASARGYYADFADPDELHELVQATRVLSQVRDILICPDIGDGYHHIQFPTLKGIPMKSTAGLGDAFAAGLVACL